MPWQTTRLAWASAGVLIEDFANLFSIATALKVRVRDLVKKI
jgi:hypothetical protein